MAVEHDDTLPVNPRSTIEPERVVDDAGERALARVAGLRRGGVTLDTVLGVGGMGIVHRGEQTALARTVAVKTLRGGRPSRENTMQLLREAWTTGALEHPNVVPVYDISLDGDGQPLVVLRRIEGTVWSAVIGDPKDILERFGAQPLAFNLRVLIQVANAVHFAHRRGILHRDLKPDNVMLGELGEVYLLDWGIAVAMDDDGTGRLSLLRDVTEPAGTPCYMAPEMWVGDPTLLSPRTDVYLLGAILYEILTGQPPHSGSRLAVLRSSAPPPPPSQAPSGLVAICMRALDPDPEKRPETALAFRRLLDEFLVRAEAETLVDQATAALASLRGALAQPEPTRAEVYDRYGACRFGFEQALARMADVRGARQGLVDAATAMVDYELAKGEPSAAEALLASFSDAPAPLRARVADAARARAETEAQRRALETLGRQWDGTVGRRTRLVLVVLLGSVWTILPVAAELVGLPPRTYRSLLLSSSALLGLALGVVVWGRSTLFRTQLNRGIAMAVVLAPIAQLVLVGGCALLSIRPEQAAILFQFLWFLICALVAATLDARIAVAAAGYLVGFLVAAAFPQARPLTASLGHAVLAITVAVSWRRAGTGAPSSRASPGPRRDAP